MVAPYAELACQSAFSFLRAASEPEALVERACELGYSALALTDFDGLYGSPRFHLAARRMGLQAIHGTTLTLGRGDPRNYDGRPEHADDRVVLLAQDARGWRSLCRLVSAARSRSRSAPTTPLDDLRKGNEGLLALIGPHLGESVAEALVEGFGRDRAYLMVHDRLLRRDRRGQQIQKQRAQRLQVPLLAAGDVRFATRADKPVHDVLACVRHKVTLEWAATRLLPNAEFCLRPRARIARLLEAYPEACARTLEVAARCTWSLDDLSYRFPAFPVAEGETPMSVLRAQTRAGARRRYRPLTAAAAGQLQKELAVIESLELAGYFLVVADVVRFCGREGILCQGRGSAANSAVCYALGITSVDPVGMDLLFERFLSEERGETPDIDLDLAHQDRERVLQYVYERYGREHAALAAEVVTWRARSAVRDVGKALGFSLREVDALAKSVDPRFDGDLDHLPAAWDAARRDPRLPLLLRLAARLQGLPRHLSIHVGGMVITGAPLTDCLPVEPAAMPGRTVVPWDKDDLESLGILKIDLLGLGMLTVLDRCLRSVNADLAAEQVRPAARPPRAAPVLELHTVPADDPETWDMLCAADTVGVFQVESRAQMNCLPRLRPRCFYDLVVEVALIRPGPIQGDMVHPYLRRRAGREAVSYPHPSLASILRRTLGVPLFQEQGMKIAVTAAGFTPGEADELRRAMGHKRSQERMAALSQRLVQGMEHNGIDRAAAERIQQQLSAFADYGFPESHAASFARLVWVSAWLKRHFPAHFLCALLNAQPMGFYAPAVLVSDARRHGVTVLPVDVLESGWECTLAGRSAPDGRANGGTRGPPPVRLGLATVRGLGERQEARVRAVLDELPRRGPFTSPEDFARRTGLSRAVVENLARLGAFRGFERRRRAALWRVARLARRVPGPLAEPAPPERSVSLPALTPAEIVREDFLLGGISTGRHPLELLRPALDARGVLAARCLQEGVPEGGSRRRALRSGEAVRVAGMVICRQRPPTARGLTFVTLEDETGFANLIVLPDVAERDRPGLHAGLLLACGHLERSDGVVNLRATSLEPLVLGPVDGLRAHDYR